MSLFKVVLVMKAKAKPITVKPVVAKRVKLQVTQTVKRPAAAKSTKPAKFAQPAKAIAPRKPTSNTSAVKPAKKIAPVPVKVKLVRDSFTLPETDHDLIKQCKKAAIAAGRETKKSEVVRAAIRAFCALPVADQLAGYAALQTIAVGRPKTK
jgi:hypothetical protein